MCQGQLITSGASHFSEEKGKDGRRGCVSEERDKRQGLGSGVGEVSSWQGLLGAGGTRNPPGDKTLREGWKWQQRQQI